MSFTFPKTIAQIWVIFDMHSDILSSMWSFCKEKTKRVGKKMAVSYPRNYISFNSLKFCSVFFCFVVFFFIINAMILEMFLRTVRYLMKSKQFPSWKRLWGYFRYIPNIWNPWVHDPSLVELSNMSLSYSHWSI